MWLAQAHPVFKAEAVADLVRQDQHDRVRIVPDPLADDHAHHLMRAAILLMTSSSSSSRSLTKSSWTLQVMACAPVPWTMLS